MTKFLNWDESIVEEFLRVAEEAISTTGSSVVPGVDYGLKLAIERLKRADYSKIEESLRNTVGALQKRLTETEFALATSLEQEGEQLRHNGNELLRVTQALNNKLAQVCNERDALVEKVEEAGLYWDGSRFYEASSDQ